MVLVVTVGVSLPTVTAFAQSFAEMVLPMTGEQQSLIVTNTSALVQSLWVSRPVQATDGLIEEKWDIPPHSKQEIPLLNYQEHSFLRLESMAEKELELSWRFTNGEASDNLPWGVSNELFLQQGFAALTVWLTNTSSNRQKINLVDAVNGNAYDSWSLSAYETKQITYRGMAGALKLVGSSRIAAIARDGLWHKAVSFTPLKSSFVPKAQNPLFEVSSIDSTQSFIVELTDPQQIAAARTQIANPKGRLPRLLVAEISDGENQINQDLKSKLQAPWSWHIKRVYRFADFASIDCDGSAGLVEKTLPWWQEAKGGLICFWGYRVTRELKP